MFALSRRDAGLAITVSPPAAGRLTARKITGCRLRLCARADVLERAGGITSMADLCDVRGISYISNIISDKELDYHALLGRASDPPPASNRLDHAGALPASVPR